VTDFPSNRQPIKTKNPQHSIIINLKLCLLNVYSAKIRFDVRFHANKRR